MRECILLFQFDQTKQRKLVAQLLLAKFKVKVVSTEELELPMGYLAGNKELLTEEEAASIIKSADREPLDREMLVMAGMTGDRLNKVLQSIRKAGIGPLPYKAVVTETNQHWKAKELLEELKKEHEAMKEQTGEGRMLHEQG
ncbi:MAG: DUF3783 domain-containing protein [Acetatifactor sp.]